MKFDTRNKKPKIYNIAVLSAGAILAMALILRRETENPLAWGNLLLSCYFGAVVFCLLDAFRKQLQYNPYSYNTILYTGFALFVFSLFATTVFGAVQAFRNPESFRSLQMLYTLLHSAKNYMFLSAPFLILFSGALFISNVSLIRHEGRRFVNILGIILAFCLVLGEILIAFQDLQSSFATQGILVRNLTVNLMAALYLYFECMIIGAIIADVLAARHVPEKDKDFLIILGCGLKKDGTPTPLLKGRIDLALRFFREQLQETGKQALFVVSGGQGPDEIQPEALSMRDYLLEQGIPEEQIILEDQSSDTAENMRFSKEKIVAVKTDAKVAFFTTNYHVFRAGLKARQVKMRAVGMGAPTRWYFWPNAAVREFVGLLTEHRGKQALVLLTLAAVYTALTIAAYG
ncbi:MAG: YdcF family protein [Oscillospiraceae bacterium]|nr:YdcF family protein [Oscillospiraceae bacterium]